ncbi:hypothetical protein AB0L04_13180 [Streptomyces glaucescens]|uniref:hypothetical protein n=1 Tax=Streptomyces glaucescens TaxID=1907 RepID=UPI00344FFE46
MNERGTVPSGGSERVRAGGDGEDGTTRSGSAPRPHAVPVRERVTHAAHDLLGTFSAEELRAYEDQLPPGETLLERIVDCAQAALVRAGTRGVPLPRSEGQYRALVSATLTARSNGSGVHRNAAHALTGYLRLRPWADVLPLPVLVRSRHLDEDMPQYLAEVLAVRDAALAGMPRLLREQPDVTALLAVAALYHPGDVTLASRAARRVLDAAVELEGSYRAAGEPLPAAGVRVRGTTRVLGDAAAPVLTAAAREVCLPLLLDDPDLVLAPEKLHERMAGTAAELYRSLERSLAVSRLMNGQPHDADFLDWYDLVTKRLAQAAGLGERVHRCTAAVSCLHPWTANERIRPRARHTILSRLDGQESFPAEDAPQGSASADPEAHAPVVELDLLLRSTVSRILIHEGAGPLAHAPDLLSHWLQGRSRRHTAAELWWLATVLRSLTLNGTIVPGDGEPRPWRTRERQALRNLEARALAVADRVEASRRPHEALALILPPLWERRTAAVSAVAGHLRTERVSPQDAQLAASVLVCAPGQVLLAATAPRRTADLDEGSADALVPRPDRPWTQPGVVDDYTTLAERALLPGAEAARKRLKRYRGPSAHLVAHGFLAVR